MKTYLVTIPDEYVLKLIEDTRDYVEKIEYVATTPENPDERSHVWKPDDINGKPNLNLSWVPHVEKGIY